VTVSDGVNKWTSRIQLPTVESGTTIKWGPEILEAFKALRKAKLWIVLPKPKEKKSLHLTSLRIITYPFHQLKLLQPFGKRPLVTN
jgi:hypothetical protein